MSSQHMAESNAVCTTPWNVTEPALYRLNVIAQHFGCRRVERNNRSVIQICQDEHVDVVVVADEQPKLYHRNAPDVPVFFHPGMAQQRLAAMRRGERDRLVQACGVGVGDLVLDATLGLGADSLVLASVVGDSGQVWSVETSWFIGKLFEFASVSLDHRYQGLNKLLKRIRVSIGDHLTFMQKLPDDSVDIVLFDPMFRRPPDRESSLDALRLFTHADPLREAAWQEAQRVARRCVVLKERPFSGELERFRVRPDKPRARFAFGVWRKE